MLLGSLIFAITGCGPTVPRGELGEVIFEVPEFADKPDYTLPDLAPGSPRTIESPAAPPATPNQS